MKTPSLLAIATVVAAGQLSAQSVGRIKDPDSLTWRPAGAGVEMALVDGNPQGAGDFTFAMRFKAGGIIPPHFHPGETRVLVVRGEVRVGFGDEPDTLHARVIGPGGFAAIPAEAHHFEAGKTDALVFLTGPGPLKTTMVKPGGMNHP
ncbi:MAG TPA: cupin domain-containing protein [Gemmatimonadaceae bacterium]|jgi:quercetin dioxygenase-like cupin family protein